MDPLTWVWIIFLGFAPQPLIPGIASPLFEIEIVKQFDTEGECIKFRKTLAKAPEGKEWRCSKFPAHWIEK